MTRSPEGRRQDEEWARYAAVQRGPGADPFDRQLARFREIFQGRPEADGPPRAWEPGDEILGRSNLGRLLRRRGASSYRDLHRWSAGNRPEFWREAIRTLGVRFAEKPREILEPGTGVTDPRWLPGAVMNIVDSCFLAAGGAPAVLSGREGSGELETITFAGLEAMVNRVASGLRSRGFRPGDPIALYLPMTPECVAGYLGIIRAGCVAVSVADSFPAGELRRRMEIAGARAVMTVPGYVRGGKRVDLLSKVRQADPGQVVLLPGEPGARPEAKPGDILWEDLLGSGATPPGERGDPARTANILFSSGTTGTPKAIPWTHLTPLKSAMDGHFHQDIRPGDVVAWPTNIGWMMGPWLIFASLINKASMALYQGAPHGEGFRTFLRDAGVTMLGVIPSLVRAWRAGGRYESPGWESLRTFSSTGEPSGQEDYLWLMSRTGYRCPVIEYLGGTEIGGGHITGTVVQPASPATFTTPALGLDFVILDESGRPVPEGSSGELFLMPPSIGLSQRLLNADHEETYHAGAPAGPGGETLRRHGDRIARLHGGFFKAQGRADDAMNLGGIKVSSMEIERVAQEHPAVEECAAVAVQPEGDGAERLVIFAVCRGETGAEALRREIGAMISRNLNPLFRLHDLVILDALPRTASNKVMRRELRAGYSRRPAGG